MRTHYAISLFSGAGGLDLGVEAAGFTTKLCTDIDDFSCKTLMLNKERQALPGGKGFLREANIVKKNIKEYSSTQILKDAGLKKNQVDLIYGGPPCQAFSVFGKRQGMDDPRGTLLWDYIRIIKDIQPKFFIFENVGGLLTIDEGAIFDSLKHELSTDKDGNELYSISYELLNTAAYGIPQYRQRVIIYGRKGRHTKKVPLPVPTHYTIPEKPEEGLLPPVTVDDALRFLPRVPDAKIPNHIGRKHGPEVMERYAAMDYGQRDSKTRINRLDPRKPSYTIVVGSDKGGGKGHVHPYEPREVTPRESARMQSFPDFWEFTGTSRHPIRQVGNAVPPLFAAIVASNLLKYGFGESDTYDREELIHRLGLTYLERGGNEQ